jgi:NtrC-family two-component system sensor histidine kinase KinB
VAERLAETDRRSARLQGPADEQPSDATLRALLGATTDGLALVRDARIEWANAAFAALAGLPEAKDVVGLPLDEIFADAGHGVPAGPGHGPCRCRLVRAGQESRLVVVEPIACPTSRHVYALRVRDVTDLHTLESEVLRTGRLLHDANRELVALRERLRVETAEREEILTVVSHELRTPITVIAGFNRLLLGEAAGSLTEKQKHFLAESQKSCQRLNNFVANLLEAARQGSCVGPLEVAEASLGPTLQSVLDLLAPLLREAEVEALLDVAPGTPRARFDPPRIEQVLTNLVGNALRYAPAGTAIEIRACGVRGPERDYVEVSVSDAGPGVPPRERARIFEPYVQVEAPRAGGLGLGLAICKRIVEAHGGAIQVEERSGGGSRFVFRLPAASPAEERA